MNNSFSDKDKKDWQNFVSSNQKLYDKDYKTERKTIKTRSIDLHGYTLEDANIVIKKFITK